MRLPEEIFEDPRSKSRIDMADQKTLIAEVEELPEAEDDWYLKRKPAVGYIGPKKIEANKT